MPTTKRKTSAMTDEHKAALAAGRAEGRAIRDYLNALESNKPRRGRKSTPESIQRRIGVIDSELASAAPIKRIQMIQERIDLTSKLSGTETRDDLPTLEASFVKAAKGYSERKGIGYAAWHEVGVSAAALSKAGVSR